MSENKDIDKARRIRRMSREDNKLHGHSGFYMNNKDFPSIKQSLQSHIDEVSEETEQIIHLGFSDIFTAFKEKTIGTKVLNSKTFLLVAIDSIADCDFKSESVPGQAVIDLPSEACQYVSTGVGKRTMDPNDYVVRAHREKVCLFLKRDYAEKCDNVRIVVYTLDAYLDDPDVDFREANRILAHQYTHILVAVLASVGPKSPLSPGRFVHNLAGGNNEALQWTADEIRDKASEIKEYYDDWCTIAD